MDLSNSKYLTTKTKDGRTIVTKLEDCQFQTRQEMVEAMQDKRYAQDEEYHALVGHMMQRGFASDEGAVVSGRELNRAMSDPAGSRRLEDEAIFREQTQTMFQDPRYATSPTYRRQVEDWIKTNTPLIDASMPAGSLTDRTAQNRQAFRITLGENSSLYDEIKQSIRDKEAAAEEERIAAAHRRLDAGESADMTDLGGKAV